MATQRALMLISPTEAPTIQNIPVPEATPGSVTLRVLNASVISYVKEVYPPTNTRGYPYPYPMIAGSNCIARVESTPPDTSLSLRKGQLVMLSIYVRGREDGRVAPSARYLLGVHEGFTDGSRSLMRTGWRDGSIAEVVRVPVENAFVLDEARLLGPPEQGGLGIDAARLGILSTVAVPFGGFRAVGLGAGESVAIAPSTGGFGGAAVAVALSMGARVIALGRSQEGLDKVKKVAERIGKSALLRTIVMSGDEVKDAAAMTKEAGMGGLDVYFDISPPQALKDGVTPAYLRGGINALRHGGRVVLMGGLYGDVSLPHSRIMHYDLTIKGKWMYEPEDMRDLIKMVEAGTMSLDWVDVVGRYPLDRWQEAWDVAEANGGIGQTTVIEPSR